MTSSEARNNGRKAAGFLVVLLVALAAPIAVAQDQPPVEIAVTLASTDPRPGQRVVVRATVTINDGSMIESVAWTQTEGVPATILRPTELATGVRLPPTWRYRAELVQVLEQPPVGPEELPPTIPLPPADEFPAGLQDRFEVVGINPFALEEAGLVGLELAVTTTSGVYRQATEIHTALPWKPSAGIENVAIGIPVLLNGRQQDSYNWRLETPMGSQARLMNAGGRNPEFTPDVAGLYTVDVTDEASAEPVVLEIYAGTWRGIIVGQTEEGVPVVDEPCQLCHIESPFAPNPISDWEETGHAEILTSNLNNSRFYRESCFSCHGVGWDPEVDNGGFDDAPDYAAFLDSGLIGNPGDNWTTMLDQYPESAQLANVQCENCHGPGSSSPGLDTLAHGWRAEVTTEPRISLSSDVCATCHGEPLRHARFQQWQLSGHANYELAIDESGSGNCSRCHTVNGFLSWLPVLLGEEDGDPLANIEVTWTADEAHPQTCVACHDPHSSGTTSGLGTDATVRISGDTPPLIAGFQVTGAGRGAICMTCHNSRRGLRNDAIFADIAGTAEAARAPHGSAQTDVLMGENAFMVDVGVRGGHSLLEDTCANCHMERTPPPDLLSYNQGGTNHTFFASPEICGDCHQGIDADSLQGSIDAVSDHVLELIESALLELITELTAAGSSIDLNGAAQIDDAGTIADIRFGESRGRQAITVTFKSGTEVGPVRMNDISVVQPAPLPTAPLYDLADESLIKAGWNWALIHNDGSRGVHNPRFAMGVLAAAREALGGRGGPRAQLPAAPLKPGWKTAASD